MENANFDLGNFLHKFFNKKVLYLDNIHFVCQLIYVWLIKNYTT